MWTWLLGLFRAPRPVRSPRQIYRFWDGDRHRFADPIEAWDALETTCDGWVELLKTISADPPPGTVGLALDQWHAAQADAARKVAEAVCTAFGVEPLSEGEGTSTGLTRTERIALAADFLAYMGDLAHRATVPTPSLSPTGASLPA